MPAPVLAGSTLAWPTEYENNPTIRGGTEEMLDGSITIEVVDSNLRRTFTMAWVVLTAAQKGTIETSYATIITAPTTNNFTDVEGTSFSVTGLDGLPALSCVAIKTAAGIRWNVRMTFREA